jgi:ABC-2 type transport system ATP-binding protein
MLHGPEVLILDEPSTGLDPVARRDLRDHLRALRDGDGMTVLLTTHLMDEAEACDRIAILDGGRLVALDRPETLKRSVGGEVVRVQAEAPEAFGQAVRERFGLDAQVIDGTVRVTCRDGQAVMLDLLRAFGEEIVSIALGKPTLEDAFIRMTGHKLEG